MIPRNIAEERRSHEGKRLPSRPSCRWADNIKTELRKARWNVADWIYLGEQVAGSCEYGSERLGSIIAGNLTEEISASQALCST
jgi:hypothetical protein